MSSTDPNPSFSARLVLALAVLGVAAALVAWWVARSPGHVLFIELQPAKMQIAGSLPTGYPDAPEPGVSDAVRAAQQDWYDQAHGIAQDIVDQCAEGGMDVACMDDWCVIRFEGRLGPRRVLDGYLNKPSRLAIGAARWAGVLDKEQDPCWAAEHRFWSTFTGAMQQPGTYREDHAFCGARHREWPVGGPFPDPTPSQLCNQLAGFRGGPEAQIYKE